MRRSVCLLHTRYITHHTPLTGWICVVSSIWPKLRGPQGAIVHPSCYDDIEEYTNEVNQCIYVYMYISSAFFSLNFSTIYYTVYQRIDIYIYIMCIACGFTSLFIYVHVIHDVENRWCMFQNDSFLWGKTNQYMGVASFTFTTYYTFKSYNKNQRSKQEIQHGSEVLSSNKHFKLRLHNMLSVR